MWLLSAGASFSCIVEVEEEFGWAGLMALFKGDVTPATVMLLIVGMSLVEYELTLLPFVRPRGGEARSEGRLDSVARLNSTERRLLAFGFSCVARTLPMPAMLASLFLSADGGKE